MKDGKKKWYALAARILYFRSPQRKKGWKNPYHHLLFLSCDEKGAWNERGGRGQLDDSIKEKNNEGKIIYLPSEIQKSEGGKEHELPPKHAKGAPKYWGSNGTSGPVFKRPNPASGESPTKRGFHWPKQSGMAGIRKKRT